MKKLVVMCHSGHPSPEPRKLCRSTAAQIRFIIDYMSSHRRLANNDFSPGPCGNHEMVEEWNKLKNLLKDYGPDKSIDQWRHSWRDLRRKAIEQGKQYKKAKSKGEDFEISPQNKLILESIKGYEEDCGNDDTNLDSSTVSCSKPKAKRYCKIARNDEDTASEKAQSEVRTKIVNDDPLEENEQEQEEQDEEMQNAEEVLENFSYGHFLDEQPNVAQEQPNLRRRRTSSSSNENTRNTKRKINLLAQSSHDPMQTLNKFIDYEREKEHLNHRREMTRLAQNERVLNMAERFVNILDVLTPSIQKFLEKSSNDNNR